MGPPQTEGHQAANFAGVSNPASSKAKATKNKKPPKLAPESSQDGNSRHPCSRPIKNTKYMHREPHRKNTDENIIDKNNTSGNKLESETLRPLTPEGHTLQDRKHRRRGVWQRSWRGDGKPHSSTAVRDIMTVRRRNDNEVHVQQLGGEVRKVNHIHSPISLTSERTPARRWDPRIRGVLGTARRDGTIGTDVRIRVTDQNGSRANARSEAK